MKKNIAILIHGSSGRMGKALLDCVPHHPEITTVLKIDRDSSEKQLKSSIGKADVVVDFSSHSATPNLARLCAERGKALVIGTTGFSEADTAYIYRYSQRVPIVMASNFSIGANVFFYLTRKAAEILGPDFDIEVVEMHHRLKKDAPSGTAKKVVDMLKEIHQLQLDGPTIPCYGRKGIVGPRNSHEIGVHSIRGGDVVGDHTVIFAGVGERVELSHKASSREIFANGALLALGWVKQKPPGLYSMENVLGLT